ncbi:MAG TPA: heme biosynthesis HemY N-terminal domain-containing protein [Burkholderiales bacterium]|nr:heme biosynthesis HemY N-terminal domain-containing protein [Burkholderiales bacterium]
MKALFWLIAIFALAVGLTLAFGFSNGYVLVVQSPYRIELSLNLAILLLLGAFIVVYFLVRLAVHTLRLPAQVRAYRLRRRGEKARQAFAEALRHFFEGRYGKAEKAAANALELGESPGLTALLAARAAHEVKAFEKRDEYLAKAEKEAPDVATARVIIKAEMLLDQRRPIEALDLLWSLNKDSSKKHVAALRLELRAQQQAKNWEQVLQLIAQLEKRGVYDETQARGMRLYATQENLKRQAGDVRALKEYWRKIPSTDKKNLRVAATAARCFMALGGCRLAHEIIEESLENEWDSDLICHYSECLGQDAETLKQIQRAESWLISHRRDACLLLTLGKLCVHQALWGKAQSYLEASISVEPTPTAHRELAKLYEKTGRNEAASVHYRKSLDLAFRQLGNVTGGRRKAAL